MFVDVPGYEYPVFDHAYADVVPRSCTLGAVYVYDRPFGNYYGSGQEPKILHVDGDRSITLGVSVAVNGEFVVAGAPDFYSDDSTHVFALDPDHLTAFDSGIWIDAAKLTDFFNPNSDHSQFGTAVSISEDSTILVGDPSANDDEGRAFAFLYDGANSWGMSGTGLYEPNGEENTGFGRSVSISGNTAVIGATHAQDKGLGSVTVFEP